MKGEFFDHRLRANLDYYNDQYSNLVGFAIVNTPVTHTVIVPSDANFQGVEASLLATPIDHLTLTAVASYIYALEGKNPAAPSALGGGNINATGLRIPMPPVNFNVGARYDFQDVGPGILSVSANYDWHASTPTDALNDLSKFPTFVVCPGSPITSPGGVVGGGAPGPNCTPQSLGTLVLQPAAVQRRLRQAIGLVNAQVQYTIPQYGLTLAVFATNLLNLHYQTGGTGGLPFGYTAQTQDPAMFGVSIKKSFGAE
jgi:outer membrane receptor protein involved in Fe transport